MITGDIEIDIQLKWKLFRCEYKVLIRFQIQLIVWVHPNWRSIICESCHKVSEIEEEKKNMIFCLFFECFEFGNRWYCLNNNGHIIGILILVSV